MKPFTRLFNESNSNRFPKLFGILDKLDGELVGVHFSNNGFPAKVNPRPFHTDAFGIYVFPKDYVTSGKLSKNSGFMKYRYIHVIEPTSKARILDLGELTVEGLSEILDKMGIPAEYLDMPQLMGRIPGERLWLIIKEFKEKTVTYRKNSTWNTLFRKAGYNVVYDPGHGIIHWNEDSQIIYMDPTAYRVVGVVEENPGKRVMSEFVRRYPEARPKSYEKYGEKHLNLFFPDADILVTTNPDNYNIKVYGREDYPDLKYFKYETDISEAFEYVDGLLGGKVSKWREKSLSEDRISHDLLVDFCSRYNLKPPDTGNTLNRKYLYGGYPVVLSVTFSNSDDGGEHLMVSVNRNIRYYHEASFHLYTDFVEIVDRDYDRALKDAFGQMSSMENVSDEKTAKTVLEFLSKRVFRLPG